MIEKIVLLLVEDEALVRLAIEDTLNAGGYDVITACDGGEAIRIIEAHDADISGLVTDIRLGKGPNGWDVAHKARELNSQICVVYATADSVADWPANGVPKSIILQKPFADSQLVTAVATLLNEVPPRQNG